MKKVVFISLIANLIIAVLDFLAILQSFIQWMPKEEDKILWYQCFTYYTECSNISLCIGSISMVILDILLLKGKDNKILSILKYLGVTTTMVTFITVYFFIIYMKDIRLGVSMMGNMWLIVHTICPILGIISYLFLDFSCNMKYKYVIIPIAFTICYTIMILIVYMANGRIPYVSDFENDYNVDGWFILLLGVMETIITSILAFIIIFIKNRMERFKYLRR